MKMEIFYLIKFRIKSVETVVKISVNHALKLILIFQPKNKVNVILKTK